jgi:hypothetical protein
LFNIRERINISAEFGGLYYVNRLKIIASILFVNLIVGYLSLIRFLPNQLVVVGVTVGGY